MSNGTDANAAWNTEEELSALLWDAREVAAMFGDVLFRSLGSRDAYVDGVTSRLDNYRARRGWSPNGFGGETGPPVAPTDTDRG